VEVPLGDRARNRSITRYEPGPHTGSASGSVNEIARYTLSEMMREVEEMLDESAPVLSMMGCSGNPVLVGDCVIEGVCELVAVTVGVTLGVLLTDGVSEGDCDMVPDWLGDCVCVADWLRVRAWLLV
jgi:hypothetical protein